jgi:hypothetical protein
MINFIRKVKAAIVTAFNYVVETISTFWSGPKPDMGYDGSQCGMRSKVFHKLLTVLPAKAYMHFYKGYTPMGVCAYDWDSVRFPVVIYGDENNLIGSTGSLYQLKEAQVLNEFFPNDAEHYKLIVGLRGVGFSFHDLQGLDYSKGFLELFAELVGKGIYPVHRYWRLPCLSVITFWVKEYIDRSKPIPFTLGLLGLVNEKDIPFACDLTVNNNELAGEVYYHILRAGEPDLYETLKGILEGKADAKVTCRPKEGYEWRDLNIFGRKARQIVPVSLQELSEELAKYMGA